MIWGAHPMAANAVWEVDAVGFAGSSKRKFSIAVLLEQKFPSCTSRAEAEVPGRFSLPPAIQEAVLGAVSWAQGPALGCGLVSVLMCWERRSGIW